MHEQIINLQQIFDNNRNPENAVHMEKYMHSVSIYRLENDGKAEIGSVIYERNEIR